MAQLVDSGFIPPPPNAYFEQPGGYNPFPGAVQTNWVPPATAPFRTNYGPPWAADVGAGRPNAPPAPWSPYPHHIPALSSDEYTPATGAPPTPGLGQPIGPSPYFNVGAGSGPEYGETPLERRHSQDPPYPYTPWFSGYYGRSPLQRSLSTDPIVRSQSRVRNPFARASLEPYDAENLAKRPRDWRPDYPKTLIPRIQWPRLDIESKYQILRIQWPRLDIEEFKDPIKRMIHPILHYNPQFPPVIYELSSNPDPQTLSFPILGRVYNHIDFAQLATIPPVDHMRLFHPLLPWYIDVYRTMDNGVTVQDVIMHVYMGLQTQINARDYFNEELGSGTRERIATAYARRTQGNGQERGNGIRKLDYLEEKNIFVGLVRARDGMWEMKTRSA
ncbi:hypothetical protein E4T56_gene5600 [Termitomyces sp. T112]|nr:hypothetical protein E4T56_gene5600 [Termitomyces sp. T112]